MNKGNFEAINIIWQKNGVDDGTRTRDLLGHNQVE